MNVMRMNLNIELEGGTIAYCVYVVEQHDGKGTMKGKGKVQVNIQYGERDAI